MPDGNLPADAGTADTTPLSFDQGVSLLNSLEEKSEAATGKAPPPEEDEEDTPPAEQAAAEEDEQDKPEGEEPAEEEPEDDTPEWDKPDKSKPDDKAPEGFASPNAKFKLEDGTEVTVADLARNNMFQADYTRKTQAVAQEREVLHQRFAQVQQFEQQLTQQTELTLDILARLIPPEPTAELRSQDPIGYMEARAARDDAVRSLQSVYEAQQNARNQTWQQATAAQRQAAVQRQQQETENLLMKMPQLRDAKKREAFANDIVKGATEYGFEPRELSDLVDHRYVMMMADAIRYRRSLQNKGQAKQRAETAQRSPVPRPVGTSRPALTNSLSEKKALERLSKTGSMEAAIELEMLKAANRKPARRK